MQYRNLFAALVALATTVSLGLVFHLAGGSDFLMPGPLQSGHGTIDKCSTCHTKSGEGKLGWFHGLIAGDPTQNAYIESFNGRLREECLNLHWFTTLEEARAIIEEWRVDYNGRRPHSSLAYQTPSEFAASRGGHRPQGPSALPLCAAPAQPALAHTA